VESPSITSAEWAPSGHDNKGPIGYNEAILSAVAQWRYPPRERACRQSVPIEFKIDGSSSTTAGGSNNSFKPKPLRGSA
jgi:hypothetical protein